MAARRRVIMWFLVILLVVVFMFIGAGMRMYLYNLERFPQGFHIGGIDVSGMEKALAEAELGEYVRKITEEPLVLRYGNHEWKVNPRDVGFTIDVSKTVQQALLSLLDSRFPDFMPIRRKAGEVLEAGFVYNIDENSLTALLDKIASQVTVLPRNAMFMISADDKVSISNSSTGVGIDFDWAKEEMRKVLFSDKGRTVVLRSVALEPAISREALLATGITGLLAEYRTVFDPSDEARSHNIRLVSQAIDGVILRPQEVFSFNKIVGPRTKSRGYQEATVIVNFERSIDVGGGICQVSSTLYNAVLLANLGILERHHHSLPVTYISPGRDATVAYDFLDFKFVNTHKTHILVRASVVDDEVIVKIYGSPNPRQQVFVRVTEYENLPYATRDVLDPMLPKGVQEVRSEGSPGYRAVVTRIVQIDGEEILREQISEDILVPRERVVHIGTGNG